MSDGESKFDRFQRQMRGMCNAMEEAQQMSNADLSEMLANLDRYGISSLESAIFGEVVFRLTYLFTWKIRNWWRKFRA